MKGSIMNRLGTIIFFSVLFLLIIILYVFVYHVKRKKALAIALAGVLGFGTALSISFVIPFQERSRIVSAETTPMHIEQIYKNYYAVCDDGTQYEIRTINTKLTSGYYSYQNDDMYANEKVEITRRYDYKIWGLIPAYSLENEIQIYFNAEEFYELYGCVPDINETHK